MEPDYSKIFIGILQFVFFISIGFLLGYEFSWRVGVAVSMITYCLTPVWR